MLNLSWPLFFNVQFTLKLTRDGYFMFQSYRILWFTVFFVVVDWAQDCHTQSKDALTVEKHIYNHKINPRSCSLQITNPTSSQVCLYDRHILWCHKPTLYTSCESLGGLSLIRIGLWLSVKCIDDIMLYNILSTIVSSTNIDICSLQVYYY